MLELMKSMKSKKSLLKANKPITLQIENIHEGKSCGFLILFYRNPSQ